MDNRENQINMKQIAQKMLEANNAPAGQDYTAERHKAHGHLTIEKITDSIHARRTKNQKRERP
jgi:hypothetical protein